MRKYFFGLLFLLIVGLGLWTLKDKTSHNPQTHALEKIETSKPTQKIHLIQEVKKKPIIKAMGSKTTPSSTKQNPPEETLLYDSISLEEAKLNTPPRKNIAPVGAIHITQNISTLHVGKHLTLPDIEGEDYTLTVTSTHTNPDGSTSLTAHYKDEGITYTTTITQSPSSSYINLATAKGLYEVETNNDIGYIYKTDTIRQQMQDTSTNDFTILPIPIK